MSSFVHLKLVIAAGLDPAFPGYSKLLLNSVGGLGTVENQAHNCQCCYMGLILHLVSKQRCTQTSLGRFAREKTTVSFL